MFNFLNRNKSVSDNTNQINKVVTVINSNSSTSDIQSQLNEAKKNLYDSIVSNRTDIVVAFMNEWFKEKKETTEEQLKYFFNSNYCENSTTNPLLVAYRLKNRDLVRALLNFGADPSLIDIKNQKCFTQLVKQDKDKDMKQVLSDCFMQLIVQNNLNSLKLFISSGFEINDYDEITLPDNNTYLHWASLYSSEPIVRLLLENGAEPNRQNSKGATPLHECLAKKIIDEETLHIIETLLIFKADTISLKGTHDSFKDKTVMDLAFYRLNTLNEPDVYNLIKDFLNDTSLSSNSTSTPNSPLSKAMSVPIEAATTTTATTTTASQINNNEHQFKINSEQFSTWQQSKDNEEKSDDEPLTRLLWPTPKLCSILSENFKDRFFLNDSKIEPIYIFIKPPHTYSHMDLINKLASSFSGIAFTCIHKPISSPYICVNINKALCQHDNGYSLLVSNSKVNLVFFIIFFGKIIFNFN